MFVARGNLYLETGFESRLLRLGIALYNHDGITRITVAVGPLHLVLGYVRYRPSFHLLAHQSAHRARRKVS